MSLLGKTATPSDGVVMVEPAVAVGQAVSDHLGGAGTVVGVIRNGMSKIGGMEVISKSAAPEGYMIMGERYSVVQKILEPGASFGSEPGAMVFMSDGVRMRARWAGFRLFSGEGLAKNKYTNHSDKAGYIGLAPNMPMAVVVPLNMDQLVSMNVKRGAFMAGDETVRVRPKLLPAASCLACCCGGMKPIIQGVSGTGIALINAGGTVVKKSLQPGEKILIDTESVVAFQDSVGYDVQTVGGCFTCCLGGEGCFSTELTGPGDVYLQSMSYEKLIKILTKPAAPSPPGKAGEVGEGAPPDSEAMQR